VPLLWSAKPVARRPARARKGALLSSIYPAISYINNLTNITAIFESSIDICHGPKIIFIWLSFFTFFKAFDEDKSGFVGKAFNSFTFFINQAQTL
jgi:hypothetical protein